jgi:PAS domain S-box-containing protein
MRFVSEGCVELTGYAPAELTDTQHLLYSDLIHREDRPMVWKTIQEAVRAEEPFDIEYRLRDREGNERWVWERGQGVRDQDEGDGAVILEGFISDVTERKRTEKAAAGAVQEWQATFDAANDSIWILDRDQRILRCNETSQQLFQRPREELIGRQCWEIVHGTTEPVAECPMVRARESLHREAMELRLGKRCFEVIVDPILDDGGEHVGAVHIISDITQRVLAEEALRNYSEQLERTVEARARELLGAQRRTADLLELNQSIITASSLGITAYAATSGECVLANSSAASIIGTTKEELLQQNFYRIRSWRESNLLEAATEALESGSEVQEEVHVVSTFGKDIWIDCRFVPFVSGGESHLLVLTDDVTEQRELQQHLVRSERLAVLGQLAGGVAHELRHPLGAIRNGAYYLNLALPEGERDSEIDETLEILEREVIRSERIIGGLLDFARAGPPMWCAIDLNDIIRAVLSRSLPPDAPQIQVACELDDELPVILADPDQLDLVFGNLIRNAVQAMPEGGRLMVKVWTAAPEDRCGERYHGDGWGKQDRGNRGSVQHQRDDWGEQDGEGGGGKRERRNTLGEAPKWVAVSVVDTGEGIPRENLEKIFEPLFSTRTRGIGLGLALSKRLVEGHGGTIEVQSCIGEGSTFTVWLPLDSGGRTNGRE